MFLELYEVGQRDATRASARATYNDNTVIVDTGEQIVAIHGWRGILRVGLRVYSDVETFTSIGWRVYGHPGRMVRVGTRRSRDARGVLDLGDRSTQPGRQRGEMGDDIVEMTVWGQRAEESGKTGCREV